MSTRLWSGKNRAGQALVEFALIAPILLLIVLGIIQFGQAWNSFQTITDAAREAARTAVIADNSITNDSIHNLINGRLHAAGMDSTTETATITPLLPPGGTRNTGDPRTVEIRYPFRLGWLQPIMGWSGTQAVVTLTGTNTMRQE